jgi:D-beta-D-heptose 7-phosphate kinase / D-beta-D-heptose 1-phosphate adenosyltransferase
LHQSCRFNPQEYRMTAESGDLVALVESGWRHVHVLVVGDVMLDQYVWGEVERISPEAPVPVVRALLRDEKPGGAANVAMNLAMLGASVALIGFAGDDREAVALRTQLGEHGIKTQLIGVPQASTTTKLRILSGHQQMMRLDSEATKAFSLDDYRHLISRASTALEDCAVMVLSDYAKGALTEEVCQTLIREARRKRIPVLVDPKSRSLARYRGATVICPNRKELAAAVGEAAADTDRLLRRGQQAISELGLEFMAVTLGEKGIALLREDSWQHAPAITRRVFDVSGAGDTVIAVLALALACGLPAETAARVANVAAGIVVAKVGTAPVSKEELLGALSEGLPRQIDNKVLQFDELISRVTAWKSLGHRIVFTNGCFDLLHIGHIRLLEEARRKGDHLIVGLNSNASVRKLKGTGRPIVGECERAQVLAALSVVDAVAIFAEQTPLRLIEAIRPDVLVKGGDYREDRVVGAQEVRAWGGRLELIPLVKGVSSTRLIVSAGAKLRPVRSP